ncbi:uncharacterized protein [Miscanthus floridulus]|uniref:uncharacterized protein isoform X1 n=1 Tax=Miscanthus floridulus TaxID=154761 RepID=UPI0034577920
MHQRFRVLELASLASGEQAAAFLAAVRCLVSMAAGVDHIDLAECARRGVVVANSGTVYSADVADHAVGMLVVVLRRVSAAERFVRRRLWPLHDGGYPLGSKVASVLASSDLTVSSTTTREDPRIQSLTDTSPMFTIASESELLSTPHSAESRSDLCEHLISNLEAFFAGKPLITLVLP